MIVGIGKQHGIICKPMTSLGPILVSNAGARSRVLSHLADLRSSWRDLLRHGLIELDEAQQCADAIRLTDETAANTGPRLRNVGDSVQFGQGRFCVEHDNHGSFTLLNPSRDVRRLSDNRGSDGKIVVAYCASLAQALWTAVERAMQVSESAFDYPYLDAEMRKLAGGLFADIGEITARKPSAGIGHEPSVTAVWHDHPDERRQCPRATHPQRREGVL